jgi:predicted RNase H-like HicB family nuclease
MSVNLDEQAKELAARPYTTVIARDDTDKEFPYYVVYNPELPRCLADGETIQEALVNLEDARTEYILSLLQDGLPVPPPATQATATVGYPVIKGLPEVYPTRNSSPLRREELPDRTDAPFSGGSSGKLEVPERTAQAPVPEYAGPKPDSSELTGSKNLTPIVEIAPIMV